MITRFTILVVFFSLTNLNLLAQWNYVVEEVQGVNTKADEYLCSVYRSELFFISNNNNQQQRTWSAAPLFTLQTIEKAETFQNLRNSKRIHDFAVKKDEWGVTAYDSNSTYIVASSNDYNKGASALSKLYFLHRKKTNRTQWDAPEMLPFCDDKFNYKFPFFVEELNLLLFSSDRRGGQGGMDIWYSYLTDEGWTIPANCGGQVNTSGEEWFPTFYNNDIYFSSNGWLPEKGFELFRCEGKDQWMNAIQLEYPINSEEDDFSILFLEEGRGLISSNRKGTVGGVDIFVFNTVIQRVENHGLSARLESNGITLPKATLSFYNAADELQLTGQTNLKGEMDLSDLLVGKTYKARLTGISPSLLSKCSLSIVDENGNVLRTFRFNAKGELELELLKFVYSDLSFAQNNDESVLSIKLSGKVIHTSNQTVNQKISVVILDENGEILAVAKLDKTGHFEMNAIHPEYHYQFKIISPVPTDRLVLFDNGKTIVLPILKQEAYYRRFNLEDGIVLKDENGKSCAISPEDVFIVNRIYFDWNSAEINEESAQQLKELALLMKNNPAISVKITSFADSRGNENYNLRLSQLRSKRLVEHLVSNGVNRSRLSSDYMGEFGILNECSNDVLCGEEKHAINRRTEIKFVQPS